MAATKTSAPSTVYVALLRGINVGKARQVSMADLKDIAATLGHGDVRTHLRSGNLVFLASDTTASSLAAALEEAIEARLGMRVGVVVRSATELAAVLATDPLPQSDPDGARRHVVFLAQPAGSELRDWLAREDFAPDTVRAAEREVYVWYEHGMSGSKTAERIGRRLPPSATDRNWNTLTRLAEMTRDTTQGRSPSQASR